MCRGKLLVVKVCHLAAAVGIGHTTKRRCPTGVVASHGHATQVGLRALGGAIRLRNTGQLEYVPPVVSAVHDCDEQGDVMNGAACERSSAVSIVTFG